MTPRRRTFRTVDFAAAALEDKDVQSAIKILAAGMVEAQQAVLKEQPADRAGDETAAAKEHVPDV